jgi:phosphoribosylformylglycinamidine synthase
MLLVAQKGQEEKVKQVFDKWDLPCSVIGEVTNDGILNFYMHGQLDASIPAHELVLGGGAPQYERAFARPAYFDQIAAFDPSTISLPADMRSTAEKLVALPSIASKRWIYRQYDSMVGTANTNTNAPSDAAVVAVKGTSKGLAVTTDCNSRYVYADPRKGAMIAVSEAARNIVCSGGVPLGVTNCLNFGNPYDAGVYYQFTEAIQGMGEACRKFDTPVTGGNVSFYNQNPDGPVHPTPTIGMVGLLEQIDNKMTVGFKNEEDEIYLLGAITNDLGCSEYLHRLCGVTHSPAPYFELDGEYALQQLVASLIDAQLIASAHDVSEGGLITTLLEKSFVAGKGFSVNSPERALDGKPLRADACWFGEGQSRVVVSVPIAHRTAFLQHVAKGSVPVTLLGRVEGNTVCIDGQSWGAVSDWQHRYDTAIEAKL